MRVFGKPSAKTAFTLLEVMIACGIFFMATFAILALVAGTLRNARGLQRIGTVDAGMAAAQVFDLMRTNRNEYGSDHGDFGSAYPDFSYDFEWQPYDTNGLLEVNIALYRRGSQKPADSLSILVYDSNVQTGPGARAPFMNR
jgi:Tfp pilus assembly protein PilV